ncbi:MAG: stalk domain-containing protein [Proteocatella sp.]
MIKNVNNAIARLLIATLVLITVFSSATNTCFASGKTYYVSATGSDTNSGSISEPFKTIQNGVSALTAGDTLLIREGTYTEKVNIKNSGSSSGFITIKNYPDEKVIINGNNTAGANLSIFNKSYIRIEGLELGNNSGNDTPMGISIEGAGTNIQIVNNKVYGITSNSNAHGIAVYGTNPTSPITNLLIEGNEVYNCKLGQSESMVLNGNVTEFKVINNKIHDNDNIGIDFIGYEGTAGSGETDRARDGLCSGNIVYNISSINNPTYNDYGADGIYVDGGKNIIIEGNYVKNCDIGIEMASEHKGKTTDNITVRNNLILDCTNYAALVFGGASNSNGTATNIKIYNNTVYNADTALVISNANSSTNEVKNNIFNNVNTIIEGNVGDNIIVNNMSSNAQFVSPSSENFELKAGSPCIDAGVSVDSGTSDYSLKTRIVNGTIDIGCLEYDGNGGIPETKVPETQVPETELPETELPETEVPETQVPETKMPQSNLIITLIIGNPNMIINGNDSEIDDGRGTAPIVLNGRTFLPIRAIIESIGGKVKWDGSESKATLTLEDKTIQLWINNPEMTIDDVKTEIDPGRGTVPIIVNGRTLLPIRAIIEGFGGTVGWNPTTMKITVTYPQ